MKYCQNCGNAMNDADERCGMCGCGGGNIPVQVTAGSSAFAKKPKDIILHGLSAILFFVISLSLIVAAIITLAKGQNAEIQYVQPSVLSENSVVGDYVTLDIVSSTVCYESYSEKTKATQDVYCIAYNTDGYLLFLKVPNSFYEANLKILPDSFDMYDSGEIPENPVTLTLYGTVSNVDSELIEYDADNVTNIDRQINILKSPKTYGDNSDIWFVYLMAGVLPISAFLYFFTSYRRRETLFADYGNYVELREQAKENCKYSDGIVFTDGRFLFSSTNDAKTVKLDDILCMYQRVNGQGVLGVMTNVNSRELIVVNRYGEKLHFRYDSRQEERLLNTVRTLAPVCPRAVIGYTDENTAYVKNNSVKKKGILK